MDFKDLIGKLDQLNEAEMTSRKVAGKAYGGAAQHDDEDDEDGEKKAAAPAEKRGRGRPKKAGGDAQVKAGYGGAAELQKYIVGSVPKKSKELEKLGKTKHKLSDKEPTEKKKVKESLKDWIAELDQLMEAEQLTIEPAKAATQVIKQGTKVLGQVANPQLANTIKQAIGKGEMSLAGGDLDEASTGDYSAKAARAGKDIGKPGKQFSSIAKSAAERYGSKERGEKVAGAVLAKLRKTNEADMPPNDALASPLTLESKQGVAEGLGKDIKRLATGKDVKSRAGQEIAKSQDASMKGDHKTSKKHFDRYDKLDKLANKEQGVAEAKNHMGETEYNTYAGWKSACRKAGADKFEGDSDICQAMKDGKGIGEWDGATGSVYDDSHKKKKMAEGKKPDFVDLDKDGDKKESMKKAASDAKKDKKKVDEGMDQRLKSAHHRGKAHALAKEGYNCRYDEGSEESRMYHEGYKMGLDECYGIMPLRGVVGEESEHDVVDNMASFGAMDEEYGMMEDDMEEGNAFTAALAKTPHGGKFSVGGKTFTDNTGYDANVDEMSMAFEGWDKQLSSLLVEGEEVVEEGMSISVSKGQQGAPDSVSVTASDSDADKLMALVRQMGILGDEAPASDYGSASTDSVQQHGDLTVVDDHDGMMALIKKVAGPGMDSGMDSSMDSQGSEDYADEEGHGHEESHGHEETCNECGGMMEEGHSCGQEVMGEEESEDQMEFEVSEDNAPDSDAAETTADEEAEAAEDEALATKSISEEDEEDEEEEDGLEESFANSADDTFEADMDFMTRVISGGLNKQKSTGQATIPVVASQMSRLGNPMSESNDLLSDWRKLSGIK
jgi:hypothetical protein